MSAADLARLELAKRAYKATEPGEAEVLAGVRRARLSLTRPKARRAWFSKGLVFVVLAVGSLAYAKPQALGELVEKVLPREDATGIKRLLPGAASIPLEAASQTGNALRAHRNAAPASKSASVEGASVEGASVEGASVESAERADVTEPASAAAKAAPSPRAKGAAPTKAKQARAGTQAGAAAQPTKSVDAMTDWGRVGQALAHGDNTEALSALSELSKSDDQRTRDKADLGRAQLLMAHGEPDQACALARSLTHRRAGSRIERQAQLLLKSCQR